jgi:hypothetical protein
MTDEQARPVANSDEHNYTLTVEEAADRYFRAGISRTHRAIQKYCAVSKLDCRKTETEFGEKYLVAPYSIDRHIEYIKSIKPLNTNANSRDQSRTDANVPPLKTVAEEQRTEPANTDEQATTFLRRPMIDTLPFLSARTNFCAGRLPSRTHRSKTSPTAAGRPTC